MIHVDADVGLSMIFFAFLHVNKHHITGNGKRLQTYLVLRGRRRWWRCAISSPCPLFLFNLLLLLSLLLSLVFSISPPFFRSLTVVSLGFFVASPLCLLSPLWCSSSSGFYSQRTPAILVSRRPSR